MPVPGLSSARPRPMLGPSSLPNVGEPRSTQFPAETSVAHSPPNIPANTAATVNPAPTSNPITSTSNSATADGDSISSQDVASTPNNGSLALRPRAVETPFGRSNWTWSNSFSRQMKAQITPRALPKIVNRDLEPTTVTREAGVCVIIPQMIAASPPSSPSTTPFLGTVLGPIPNPPSPAPPAAATGLSPSAPPAPAPVPVPTTTYLGDALTPILPAASAPASPNGLPPDVESIAPGFNLPDPISTRVVNTAPTTITELNSDGQPTATRTLDSFTTILEVNSKSQLVSIIVNDPITTLTELDQSGKPTATIITNVPLTTITIYGSFGLPISTRIVAVSGQSVLHQSNRTVSSILKSFGFVEESAKYNYHHPYHHSFGGRSNTCRGNDFST